MPTGKGRIDVLVNYGLATLGIVALHNKVRVSPGALKAFERELRTFSEQPLVRIVEEADPRAPRQYQDGVIAVADLACRIALRKGRQSLLRIDVEEAVKESFCHVWPFCR